MSIRVKFWGVRGSIACATPDHMKYGGNTSCIEVEAGDYRFVMDAGTGIRSYGNSFLQSGLKCSHLLLTHTHWDHINGFPFFVPAYNPECAIHIMAGHLKGRSDEGIQDILSTQMHNPMFPVPLEAMQAKLRFEDFDAGDSFSLPSDITVKTAALNHPNGATGYRIEHDGASICYVTDTEHIPGELDQNVLGLIDGADLVIYDSTYTEEEFPAKVGWGHSCVSKVVELADRGNVKTLYLFHHDPDQNDADIDAKLKMAEEALAKRNSDTQVVAPSEGDLIQI